MVSVVSEEELKWENDMWSFDKIKKIWFRIILQRMTPLVKVMLTIAEKSFLH